VTMSAFGSRQALYEYYFFGDPVRMSNVYYDAYEKDSYKNMIQEFLQRTKDTASV
jgi:4-hydroxyphenylacetate 3-monooxygenase